MNSECGSSWLEWLENDSMELKVGQAGMSNDSMEQCRDQLNIALVHSFALIAFHS